MQDSTIFWWVLLTNSLIDFISGAFGTSAVLICMAIFLDCTRQGLALILLVLFGICFSGFMPGAFTAMISIAPAYTGTIASIGSGSTVLAKILTPTIIGLVNVTVRRARLDASTIRKFRVRGKNGLWFSLWHQY